MRGRAIACMVASLALCSQVPFMQDPATDLTLSLATAFAKESAGWEGARAPKELRLTRILRKGMSGNDVKALQEYLGRVSTTLPTVSGYFGSATEAAVKRFQEREGVVISGGAGYGAVGPKTLTKLNEVVRRISSAYKAGTAMVPTATTTTMAVAQTATSAIPNTTSTATTPFAPAAALSGKSTLPAPDTTPPVRAAGYPTGFLMGITSITISLKTNELANCFWSSTPKTPFEYMATRFSSTGGTTHSSGVDIGMSGGDFAFYVRCRDQSMNVNVSDYPILFSIDRGVALSMDRDPPRVRMSFPIDANELLEGPVNILAAAADNVGLHGVNFFLNDEDLNAEDTKAPFSVTLILKPGTYTAFAVARDLSGRYATSSSEQFTVVAKPAPASTSTALTVPSPSRLLALFPFAPYSLQVASAASAFSALEILSILIFGGH